jgi:formate dehydrogenase major subunit
VLIINPFVERFISPAAFPPENPWKPQGFFPAAPRKTRSVGVVKLLQRWPVVRQLRDGDPLGLGPSVQSPRSQALTPRIDEAEHVVQSICPYCAVGCGQLVYVQDGEITQIEGDPASPISRGRLCPKGQASKSYSQSPLREYKVKYRRPYGTAWEELSLDDAMEMIAQRVIDTRAATWEETTPDGKPANRTTAIAHLGGATLDNEENYLIKKLYTALGIVAVENQARI